MKRWKNVTAGCTSAATAIAVSAHAMTRSASSAISSTSTVSASSDRIASAERTDTRTSAGRADDRVTGDSPDTSVIARTITTWPTDSDGSSADARSPILATPATTDSTRASTSIRARRSRSRSRSPCSRSTVWFVRSDPAHADRARDRRAARARAQSARRGAAAPHRLARGATRPAIVLVAVRGRRSRLGVVLVTVPTIHQVRDVQQGRSRRPSTRPRRRSRSSGRGCARPTRRRRCEQWLDDVPEAARASNSTADRATRPARSPTASRPRSSRCCSRSRSLLDGERIVERRPPARAPSADEPTPTASAASSTTSSAATSRARCSSPRSPAS